MAGSLIGSYIKAYFADDGTLVNNAPPGLQFQPTLTTGFLEMIADANLGGDAWIVRGDFVWINGGVAFGMGTLTDTGTMVGGRLRFAAELWDDLGNAMMEITHYYSLEEDAYKRLKVEVDIQNVANTEDNISYMRTTNPLQGLQHTPTPFVGLNNGQASVTDVPDGAGSETSIPISDSDPQQRHLGQGSSVIHVRLDTDGNARANNDYTTEEGVGYIQLDSVGPPSISSSGTPWPSSGPDQVTAMNLWFRPSTIGSIGVGQTWVGTYFYWMGGPSAAPTAVSRALAWSGFGAGTMGLGSGTRGHAWGD